MEIAIVTGGSRGIGKEIALRLARDGVNVVINYRSREEEALEVKKACEELGVKAMTLAFDVADYDACKEAVKKVTEELGKPTILVNNAGVTDDGLILRMKPEQFSKVVDINLKSVYNMCQLVSPIMLKNKKGRIVNMASVVGVYGNAGQANYSASKAGIIGFTKSISKELGSRGITANVVAPGFVDTDMTKVLPEDVKTAAKANISLKRFADPLEIANVVAFLASDNASYVTGQVIEVSGGLSL